MKKPPDYKRVRDERGRTNKVISVTQSLILRGAKGKIQSIHFLIKTYTGTQYTLSLI